MVRYISLLRGINVGGHNVNKTDLIDTYSELGFKEIKTYLQTGNVSFKTAELSIAELTNKLEETLSKKLEFPVPVFMVTEERLNKIINEYPFDNTDNSFQFYVIFLKEGLAEKLYGSGKSLGSVIDKIDLGDNVVYWMVPKGMTVNSPFSKLLVKTNFKNYHTNRNLNTLIKLL